MRFRPLLLIALFGFSTQADEYHHKNLLVGTKAIGLGGAFTAISDDLSAVFYNPAGLTNTTSYNSASISTFAWEKMTYEQVFSTGEDFSRSSFSIVPSFLGIGGVSNEWHWSLGFGVSDLSTERNYAETSQPLTDEEGNEIGIQTEFGNVDLDNSALNLAFGAAKKITPKLSIGAAVNLQYRKFETIQGSGINAVAYLPSIDIHSGFIAQRRIKDETILVAPSLGLLYMHELANFGFKLTKDLTINRSFSASHNIFVSSPTPLPPTAKAATVGTIRGSAEQEYGVNFSLGVAKRLENSEWSFDIDHYTKTNVTEKIISEFHPPITRDLAAVTNYSLGLTVYQTENRYFRFGIFTDNANGKVDLEQPFQRTETIDMVGISFDYTTDVFEFPLSVGAYMKYGEGQVRLADIRVIENIVGIPLYPPRANNDISDAKKSLLVLFVSANF